MDQSSHSPLWGAFWMLLSGLAFAVINSTNQWIAFVMGYQFSNVALVQYSIATLVLLPWMARQGLLRSLKTRQPGVHVLRVAVAVAGIQFWLWALAYPVPIWQAIALLMTSPLFVTVGSALFLKERVDAPRGLATLFGFAGAMLILAPWSEDFHPSALLPVVAAVCWAVYSLITKSQLRQGESPTTVVFYLFVLTLPFNLMVAAPVLAWPEAQMWPLLLLSGVLTGLAQLSLTKAYQSAEASYIQPFDLAKLPFNVLVGFWVMGTVPPGQLWLGAAVMIGASLYLTRREERKVRQGTPQLATR
ncbi:DMT family transporter [Ferrimonas marina]|uniref:Permease of the drug/metabolite transporter (DMT) superfamily n=1 Tax=Ferrimonas marina TaxID=299255 RepID=A0A1M5YVC5_9GAMM|nr:DMT family transporter [Ferrimonas marina]SHI15889.1 Permease of the drug/metabolite transporter (DMT) superfamily [Ferrimonas marina]